VNVFDLDQSIIGDYERFARSFTQIRAEDIRTQVDALYATGRFWPEPLISINPHYERDGFRCENSEGANEAVNYSLCSNAEQLFDELLLRHRITLCHPPRSSFSDHVHRFDSAQCSPSRPHRPVTFG
jgi:hypothetical protein